jgi:uncharacterized protein (DUF1330 family)
VTAYVLVEIDVTDPEAFEAYKAAAGPAAEANGATYLARGGATELLEGTDEPGRIALLRFADADAARAWYDSPEYTAARALRAGSATARFILVEGLE